MKESTHTANIFISYIHTVQFSKMLFSKSRSMVHTHSLGVLFRASCHCVVVFQDIESSLLASGVQERADLDTLARG